MALGQVMLGRARGLAGRVGRGIPQAGGARTPGPASLPKECVSDWRAKRCRLARPQPREMPKASQTKRHLGQDVHLDMGFNRIAVDSDLSILRKAYAQILGRTKRAESVG